MPTDDEGRTRPSLVVNLPIRMASTDVGRVYAVGRFVRPKRDQAIL
jgi:hypothetical protein